MGRHSIAFDCVRAVVRRLLRRTRQQAKEEQVVVGKLELARNQVHEGGELEIEEDPSATCFTFICEALEGGFNQAQSLQRSLTFVYIDLMKRNERCPASVHISDSNCRK